jgi:hypothetical protein
MPVMALNRHDADLAQQLGDQIRLVRGVGETEERSWPYR